MEEDDPQLEWEMADVVSMFPLRPGLLLLSVWDVSQAHARNLSAGLRNDWTQLNDLEPWFDWALSENCLSEGECGVRASVFVGGTSPLDGTEVLLEKRKRFSPCVRVLRISFLVWHHGDRSFT